MYSYFEITLNLKLSILHLRNVLLSTYQHPPWRFLSSTNLSWWIYTRRKKVSKLFIQIFTFINDDCIPKSICTTQAKVSSCKRNNALWHAKLVGWMKLNKKKLEIIYRHNRIFVSRYRCVNYLSDWWFINLNDKADEREMPCCVTMKL